jgi:hypothetical protein
MKDHFEEQEIIDFAKKNRLPAETSFPIRVSPIGPGGYQLFNRPRGRSRSRIFSWATQQFGLLGQVLNLLRSHRRIRERERLKSPGGPEPGGGGETRTPASQSRSSQCRTAIRSADQRQSRPASLSLPRKVVRGYRQSPTTLPNFCAV